MPQADNPLLLVLLQSTPIRDVAFERLLTALRASLASAAAAGKPVADLGSACLRARATVFHQRICLRHNARRDVQLEALRRARPGVSPSAMQIAALAMYAPLHTLPSASVLLERKWNPLIDAVLTQQLREPAQERQLRDLIPRLTQIEDEVSQRVRQQYEENPYPRWVHIAGQVAPMPIDQYLRDQFPTAAFTPLGKTSALDMLIAGCGTGQVAIGSVQKHEGAQALAIDLSLTACVPGRKTPAELASRIDHAQADILKLRSIDHNFERDPCAASSCMAIRLPVSASCCSSCGPVVDASRSTACRSRRRRGAHVHRRAKFGATPDIAAARSFWQRRRASRFTDFPTSECRDLLFMHEARVTIPVIQDFIRENGLKFIGFNSISPC